MLHIWSKSHDVAFDIPGNGAQWSTKFVFCWFVCLFYAHFQTTVYSPQGSFYVRNIPAAFDLTLL